MTRTVRAVLGKPIGLLLILAFLLTVAMLATPPGAPALPAHAHIAAVGGVNGSTGNAGGGNGYHDRPASRHRI